MIFPHEDSSPYHIYYKVLNCKNYNIPQNRDRVFIIGIRNNHNDFNFPKEQQLNRSLRDILESNVDEKYNLSEIAIKGFLNKPKGWSDSFKVKDENDILNCITTNPGTNVHSNYVWVKSANSLGYEVGYEFDSINLDHPNSRTRRGRVGRQILQTLTTSCNQGVVLKDVVRRITPRESFSGMDFPYSFKWNVSDTQAYKQAGNSIPVGLLEKIIIEILKVI